LATNLLAEDGSIGIRITNEGFSKELCRQFRKPIVSTSANISGNPSPASFREIDPAIIQAVDYVVEFRQNDPAKSKPSGIIKLTKNGTIQIIRK
jgi:L-threonylcarbamoyladenylate synthase